MKFKLSTLLWVVTLMAIILGCYFYTQRVVNEVREIAEAETSYAMERANEIEKAGIRKLAFAALHKSQLGLFRSIQDPSKPQLKFITLPASLGGYQMHSQPFEWIWRIYLPKPDEFELCWSIKNIPSTGFLIPSESIHRSNLKLERSSGPRGKLHYSDRKPIDPTKPAEVLIFVRVEANGNEGTVYVNFEITQESNTVFRGDRTKFEISGTSWIAHETTSAYLTEITGFAIEQTPYNMPFHNTEKIISLSSPVELFRRRSRNHISGMKFENTTEPTNGLIIWLQKKTQVHGDKDTPPPITAPLPLIKMQLPPVDTSQPPGKK